jgi:hypothetical protein
MLTSRSTELSPESQDTDERLSAIASWRQTLPSPWTDHTVDSTVLFQQLHQAPDVAFRSIGSMGTWLGQNKHVQTSTMGWPIWSL